MNYDELDKNSSSWHELLTSEARAVEQRNLLIENIVEDHQNAHDDSFKWCKSKACRTVAYLLRW
ncbi:hypothetical protein [Actinoplanes sp. NPDC051411]|uniref:hypothetical protein n=1 Tax=Actinoplanes sp. NPDC051411 TaxID=3155522 RepID=UPI003422586F